MGEALLEVRDLVLSAGHRTLVRRLSMQARRGELWCLLGPNGAGKTTFLEALVGLRRPDAGSIRLAGKAMSDWSPVEAARLRAYLPQSVRDAFSASVLEVVLMGRHPHLSRWQWEGQRERQLALRALQTVGLLDIADRDITTLSGGERQRAAIAALIVQDTPMMLLDEPVAHLDLRHQATILEHLGELARHEGRAILVSIHDLNLAARSCTHAMLFDGEGGVDSGPVEEVMTAPALSAALHCDIARIDAGPCTVFMHANAIGVDSRGWHNQRAGGAHGDPG